MSQFNDLQASGDLNLTSEPSLPATTAGALLRQARENAGMHLGMLSVALKVPVRNLTALEADQYNALSGPVFVRALANSVCRHLKIDSSPILALLPPASHRLELMHPGLGSSQSESFGSLGRRHILANRQFLILALAMVFLIALVVWLPSWPASSDQPDSAVTEVKPDLASAGTTVTSVISVPATTTALPQDAAKVNAVQMAIPSKTDGRAIDLVIKGKSDAWVEVKNSAGALVFNQLVKTGETHHIQSEMVLSVVVGFAEGVEVEVRGKAFDLTPFNRGSVARFEVK
jgi:cytoskeleton protein RodZ